MSDPSTARPARSLNWLYDLLFILVLAAGAFLRFSGSDWGELQHQHPDESFFNSVVLDIAPIGTSTDVIGPPPTAELMPWRAQYPEDFPDCPAWGGYFDTACSPLNPENRGKAFYVYGDLPVFVVRGLAELSCEPLAARLRIPCALANMSLFGRHMAAVADLLTVALLYVLVARLYGRRVALLGSAFSAFAVMQIQQSHFFTADSFTTPCMFLAIWLAVEILVGKRSLLAEPKGPQAEKPASSLADLAGFFSDLGRDRTFWLSIGFGVAYGMAMASKLTAVPLAILLPAVLLVRLFKEANEKGRRPGEADWLRVLLYLVVGGAASVLAFRVFQPYAFSGLFGLNPNWLASIREVRGQASPNADLPWALQWSRRTHLYSFQNLTVWGLGLPLGILAWAGFLWMAWRTVRGEWRQHLPLWLWTAAYFGWQSLQYNPTMRYQLPVYPMLGMMAAWLVVWLWDQGQRTLRLRSGQAADDRRWPLVYRLSSGLLGGVVLLLTAAWAYAFSRIYTRPETRIAASNWIFQNVPGPINLRIQAADGSIYQQPLPFLGGQLIQPDYPAETVFNSRRDGLLTEIYLPHVNDTLAVGSQILSLGLSTASNPSPLAAGVLMTSPAGAAEPGARIVLSDRPVYLAAEQPHYLKLDLPAAGRVDLCGELRLTIVTDSGSAEQTVEPPRPCIAAAGAPFLVQFSPQVGGNLIQVDLGKAANLAGPEAAALFFSITNAPFPPPETELASAAVAADFAPGSDPRGGAVTLVFDQPVALQNGMTYYLRLRTTGGSLALTAASFANETDYDYNLPFRTSEYDPFGGIYRGDLNLQVYWDDNADKLARLTAVLGQADYILIPTNHQYAQITRIPERYPLTTVYYRELIGCPEEKDIIWCYRAAEPGMFRGSLGFELAATFESYPRLGPLVINDQAAEEAFTFYDHPKVMIFRKTDAYDAARVAAILGAVDYSRAIHLTPGQADQYKSLMLSVDALAAQQAGGTWSELFDTSAIQNRYPVLGAVIWYLLILVVGLLAYPLVRAAMPGLSDGGYPLARVAGLVLWAWFAWLAGSLGLSYSRGTIAAALGIVALIGGWQAWRQRGELQREFRTRWKLFLLVEGLFLAFFVLDLLIRLGNPDLWHPAKGGERPMDFAFFNAILKSTTFPPYDPWYAGGYINYYYYGYVIVGTPVKLLGVVPSIAFNFILPTLFACLALGAFSVAWNLLERAQPAGPEADPPERRRLPSLPLFGGLAASAAMVLVGNLGILRMFYQGFQRLAAPGGMIEGANIFERIWWALKGFVLALVKSASLPYGPGDWYWFPSRALPDASGNPITEFPLFTFLYSDLHAHMIAFAITVLAIAWALSVLLARGRWRSWLDAGLGLFLGALTIGALKPTNTWDIYTYLALGSISLFYAILRYAPLERVLPNLPLGLKRLALGLGAVALLAGLSQFFYQPFSHWFYQGYNSMEAWKGPRSNLSSYLVHWGAFLFFIVSWMSWETRQWLAETPLSALRKLRPFRDLIIAALAVILAVLAVQQAWVMSPSQNIPWKGVTILWLAAPLALWAAVLLFRPQVSDTKRLVLFMTGTSLLLTMVVEIIVLRGDIGRQNTVFKLYLQAWTMLGISAAACLAWLLPEIRKWLPGWRAAWNVAAIFMAAGAALFLVVAGSDKIRDRMNKAAPHTLDSMDYMAYATYSQYGIEMDLSQDYRAIRWLQENVQGSPVIVEAAPAGDQYSWLGRYSIYTGLPAVVGWEWHEEQQRVLFGADVMNRGRVEVDGFYATPDVQAALALLDKYDVRYIILGQLERGKYAPDGIAKFEAYEGIFWKTVYRDGATVIYEVLAGGMGP